MGFLTERIKHALNLKTISKEKTSINVFSTKKFDTTELDKVCINLKMKVKILAWKFYANRLYVYLPILICTLKTIFKF